MFVRRQSIHASLISLAVAASCSGEPGPDDNAVGTLMPMGGNAALPPGHAGAASVPPPQPAAGSLGGQAAGPSGTPPQGAILNGQTGGATAAVPPPPAGDTGAAEGNSGAAGAPSTPPDTGATGASGASGATPPPVPSGDPNTGDSGAAPMPDVDQAGKANAVPGDTTDIPQDYLRLGELRILNNNWGSEDLGCSEPTSTMSVFVNQDRTFGWHFHRGDCAAPTDTSHPDFPQVEFGIHPFGIGSHLETSPPFSSTTLLPLQIKDIQSASIRLDNLNIALQNQSSWNLTAEFWLSERDPVNDPDPGVYAELMAWWGWDAGRWPCDDLNGDNAPDHGVDKLRAGDLEYSLCHQRDNWADGWRYFQFRAGDGSDGNIRHSFSGTLDIKTFLDYLVNQRGYSSELWVTRLEVGSEIDDDTSGTVSMSGITFEINGQERSQVIGTP